MVAWRVFRAIIDPANRTVLQLMTSRYRKLLLANGACVARLTCVSLCQFKELVRCTARFLTFRTMEETWLLFYQPDALRRFSLLFPRGSAVPRNAILPAPRSWYAFAITLPGIYLLFKSAAEPRFSASPFPPLSPGPCFFADWFLEACRGRYQSYIHSRTSSRIREHALARTNAT